MTGWIKLHRSLNKWEWYDDINATRVLVHLLLTVNHKDTKWRGKVIKAGSRVIGGYKFSEEVGLTRQQFRTALKKVELSGEITIKSTSQYSVVSLTKWDQLQSNESVINQQSNKRITNKQPSDNQRITTSKEDKEDKKIRTIIERKEEFKNSLTPFLEKFGKDLLNDFHSYWTDSNEKSKKMRFELSKNQPFYTSRRLSTWKRNDKQFKGLTAKEAGTATQRLAEALKLK